MGKITILDETTKYPITLIGKRAGVCWDADIDDQNKNYKRGLDCLKSNHGRALEFVNIEMIIDGYSARVIREWYTHIGGAPTRLQESTRYVDSEFFNYVIPPKVFENDEAKAAYVKAMDQISSCVGKLVSLGISREDAAMVLPLGMTTKIVDRRNLRNLIDMSHTRMCTRAYWEFRELFNDILWALKDYSPEWKELIEKGYFEPNCLYLGTCPERKSCGRREEKND